jgi:hypothetical protein
MLPRNRDLRPKRSAILPKNRSREPDVRLVCQLAKAIYAWRLYESTYEEAAFIHVISALVMSRSRPAKEDRTVTLPVRNEVMATAIVTESTKRHS